jgi:thiamine biosynthesis lipoprotein
MFKRSRNYCSLIFLIDAFWEIVLRRFIVKNNKKIIIFALLAVILTIGVFVGCSTKTTRYEVGYLDLFDTSSIIIGYTKDKTEFDRQAKFIYYELRVYHELTDIYNDYEGINNLKTINDNAGVKPVKVDKKLIDLMIFTKKIYDLTDGKVNVAFGSVLKIWHNYREAGIASPSSAELPPMELLIDASKHTDINKMIIDEQASTVYLEDKEMSIDIGAIAKGYATEQAAIDGENNADITSMLLSIGGNVRAIGKKGNDEGDWKVGIQNPDKLGGSTPDGTNILETVALMEKSLVTSGDYQRYYLVDGKVYNHIIDPETLMPADHYRGVSIIAKDSGIADALSTGSFIMNIEDALELIKNVDGAEAVFVMQDGSQKYTSGFENYIR